MERMTLSEVAEVVQGRVVGDAETTVTGIAPLEEAGSEELGLLADRGYLTRVKGSRAGALLVSESLWSSLKEDVAAVVVSDAHEALVPLLEHFHPAVEPRPGIHPTAVLGRGVVMGVDVTIEAHAVVEEGAVLADRTRVGPHAVVGRGCRVGEDSVVHPHAVLYPGTVLGRRVIVHSGARLGVDGFGYAPEEGGLRKIPQVGVCMIEDDVEIGANACIDRGSLGETRVEKGSKIDNLVHLAHNVRIGPATAIAAQVGIAGSTRVGRGVMLGGQAGLAGHLRIGDGVRIGGQAGVTGDLEDGESVTGFPAHDHKAYLRASGYFRRLPELARKVKQLEREVERLRKEETGAPPDPEAEPDAPT